MPTSTRTQADALVAALLDLDRHVGRDGWDQPPRLFALVLNDVLAGAEPVLSRPRWGCAPPRTAGCRAP